MTDAAQINKLTSKVDRHLRAGNRSTALRILQQHEFDQEAGLLEHPPNQLVKHDLKCPAHHTKVAAGCRMKSCKFWISSEISNNCILAYCHHQQVDRLSADEIAYLYAQPIDLVKSELDAAMNTLRLTAIQSDAADDPDVARVFWCIESSTICCVCGSPTDDAAIQISDTPLAYCSKECQEEKPPDVATTEYRFGRPVETVLRWAVRRFKNLPVLERTFGLKRETLIELTRQHLGRELSSYFPKVKMQPERPSWRRRINRAEHVATQEALAQHTERQTGRFGRAVLSVDHLRAELHSILS